jgi:hypothetical protein
MHIRHDAPPTVRSPLTRLSAAPSERLAEALEALETEPAVV